MSTNPNPNPPLRELRPVLSFAPELLLQAQGLRLAIFDVDGVLTDGRLFYGETGEVLKVFNTLDGHGLKLLAAAGIQPAVITGRDAPALRRRLADLGVTQALFGVADKLAAAQTLLAQLGVSWNEVAVMGDDWPDLPMMQRARFVAAPAQAHVEVRAVADYVTALPGGHGAGREFCDLLLTAAGRYADLLQGTLRTLDAHAAPSPSMGPGAVL